MRSLGHALTLLTELARAGRATTLSELAEMSGLHKSTVHRMLTTFIKFGLVRRDRMNQYSVGLGAVELAKAASSVRFAGGPVHDAIVDLHNATNGRAIYALPQFGHMVCVVASERGAVSFPIVPLFTPLPLNNTAAGKAYLAHRPEAEIDQYIKAAPFTGGTARAITTGEKLMIALSRARDLGYAVEDREFSPRGQAIAAPVLDRDQLSVASVAIGLPDDHRDPTSFRELIGAVQRCAQRIGDDLFRRDSDTAPAPHAAN